MAKVTKAVKEAGVDGEALKVCRYLAGRNEITHDVGAGGDGGNEDYSASGVKIIIVIHVPTLLSLLYRLFAILFSSFPSTRPSSS